MAGRQFIPLAIEPEKTLRTQSAQPLVVSLTLPNAAVPTYQKGEEQYQDPSCQDRGAGARSGEDVPKDQGGDQSSENGYAHQGEPHREATRYVPEGGLVVTEVEVGRPGPYFALPTTRAAG